MTGPARDAMDAEYWSGRLAELATRLNVPGSVLGILRFDPSGGDRIVEAAHGVLNVRTGVAVATDSVFQIGSITKTWTTTIVMRLVAEGLLDLDAPVRTVLPELELADPEVARRVTLRHLLTHTSGVDGDIFTDTGRGDECLERYVRLLASAAQSQPLGVTWSYCNSGFIIVGRAIEKVTGKTWDAALRAYVVEPLGLDRVCTLPEEAIVHRAAVGHREPGEAGQCEPVPVWQLPRSAGPAGLICTTAASVLAFARLHLAGGTAPDGSRLLTPESVAEMAAWQVDLPERRHRADSWGLGWARFGWDGARLIGHDGATLGQTAFLRILPAQGLAVVLLANADSGAALSEHLFREVFTALAGISPPAPPLPAEPAPETDFRAHLGRYERDGYRYEVYEHEGKPWLRLTLRGVLAGRAGKKVYERELRPLDASGDCYLVFDEGTRIWSPATFYGLPTGERFMFFALRATPKVTAGECPGFGRGGSVRTL